eukprot:TCONS_00038411-protein
MGNKGLSISIKNKDKMYKICMNTKDKDMKKQRFARFKKFKNNLTKLLRASKTLYYKNLFSSYGRNLRLIWKGIREITGGKSKSNDLPQVFIHNGKSIKTDDNIATSFNEYYSSIAEKTKSKIVPTDKHFAHFLQRPNAHSIFLNPTSPLEVLNIITKLNNNKSVGPESIPAAFLKILAPDISITLSKLFNESLTQGHFPDCLKSAKITPVHKKDSLIDLINYRPISLLSNISKIFEKILHDR